MNMQIHTVPDLAACKNNEAAEPEGERLRRELTEWLDKNGIVSIYLDTPTHTVEVGIARLPPRIKPVLRLWGSIFVVDTQERVSGKETKA